ncbi:MAG: ATPase [Candidatus Cohnella colombiensis]|uniref:Nuclease SbcCD subunit C n=1 Tax=Candidatus Cohnella colombiensis TaxID=3121368 RepID=A0AA95EU66_9BACL|nr:MAG: ATPase [Cohnella sp.]
MNISFKELKLHCFKNHRDLTIPLGEIVNISGQNGAGKSTIGEAISWCLYGTDPLGNTLIKALSPEPTTYEFDRVEVSLLLSVDGKEILLSRWIENGKNKFFINEIVKDATPYKEFVDSLFDKNLFLSLFSPGYFFSQKWEEQRGLMLKNVQNPTNKEVFARLPKPHSDKLAELLKKSNLEDLDAKHRDNKNRQDKALIAAKAVTKTLQEQLDLAKPLTHSELLELNIQLTSIEDKINDQIQKQTKDRENVELEQSIERNISNIKTKAESIAGQYKATSVRLELIMSEPPEPDGVCEKCGQPLTEKALAKSIKEHQKAIEEADEDLLRYKAEHATCNEQYKAEKAKLAAIKPSTFDADELRELQETRYQLVDQIKSSEGKERLAQSIEEARAKEKEIDASFKESVLVLDAIKSYLAKEAEIMADKVQGLFQTLTLQLFQENKGDGERKPFFEIYMNDKPYRKLSKGEQYTAGMELIEVLSKQYNVIAPIFLDNAESFTGDIRVMGQAIICRAVSGESFKIGGNP